MKGILTLLLVFWSMYTVYGQDRVTWTFSYDSIAGQFKATAKIAEGWHLYSQHINNELGPIPTSFSFADNPDLKLVGKVHEPESIKEYDENFEGELNFFKEEVTFTQKIKTTKPTELKGSVQYMVCNDTMCLPPTEQFFEIKLD